MWNLTHNIYGQEGIKNIVYQQSTAISQANYWLDKQQPTLEKKIPYIVANQYSDWDRANYITAIKNLMKEWYINQYDPFYTQNYYVIHNLTLKQNIESMKQSYRDAVMKQAKLNEDEILPLKDLLLWSFDEEYALLIKQEYSTDEMEKFVMIQRAIHKEVIDFRENRNKIKQKSKDNKYITNNKQLQKKMTMFVEVLQDLYDQTAANDTLLKGMSMVFKQLSLILNNKASNTKEIYKNVKDDYEMYYLLNGLATKKTTEVSEDVSTNLLLSIIRNFFTLQNSTNSVTDDYLNTDGYLNTLDHDTGTVINIYKNYLDMLKQNIDKNNNTTQQQLEKKIAELLETQPDNNTIERIIKEIKDEHLLETFDLFMSLIIKLSKE